MAVLGLSIAGSNVAVFGLSIAGSDVAVFVMSMPNCLDEQPYNSDSNFLRTDDDLILRCFTLLCTLTALFLVSSVSTH